MVSIGQQWSAMVSNGQQWSAMVSNGQHWSAMVSIGQQWSALVSNGQQWSALDCIRNSSASTVCVLRLALLARIMAPHVENNLSTLADEAGIVRNLT